MNKIKNIEFLRVIFLLSIMWMHFFDEIVKIIPSGWVLFFQQHAHNGGKAVDAFFIISGFLMVITFKQSITIIQFIQKKIVRLVPVIVFASLIVLIASFLHVIKFSIPAFVFNITFMDRIVGHSSLKYWNEMGSVWYVSAMFWVLLLYFYLRKNFAKSVTNLIIGICTVFSYALVLNLNKGSLCNPSATVYIFNSGMLRAFGGIGIGYFIGEWYKNNIDNIKNIVLSKRDKIIYTLFELVFLVICVLELFILKEPYRYNFTIVLYLTVLIILFIQKRGYISEYFNKDWCVELGKYSYSIYVIHQMLAVIMIRLGIVEALEIYSVIPMFLASIILGVFAYHVVEKPVYEYFRNKSKRLVTESS